tara:strand:- start:48 stop:353 length:306 start_codon:yes stop_codon:yes gene_type:complete
MWLRLFVLATRKMGFRYILPYEDDMVVHVAISEAALLASMRDYIEEHEAEQAEKKREAFAEAEEEAEEEEEEEEEEEWTKEDWDNWRADDHINDGEHLTQK